MNWDNLIQHPLPVDQYYPVEQTKTQIVLHHTVSGSSVDGDINWWVQDPRKVATCIIIGRDGKMHQMFSSKQWAHHLGVKAETFKRVGLPENNTAINQHSIGVELDSWGGLVLNPADGKYYNAIWDGHKYVPGKVAVADPVLYQEPFRGFSAFERYTPAQVESLRGLLQYWCARYNIPKEFKENIFEVNKQALGGEPGIWSHVSYRYDKSDCHPQADLVAMLKAL